MTGNYIGYLGMMLYNSALRFAKKYYYAKKISNNNRNPKASWKTINDILGRGKKQNEIKEIKLPEKLLFRQRN